MGKRYGYTDNQRAQTKTTPKEAPSKFATNHTKAKAVPLSEPMLHETEQLAQMKVEMTSHTSGLETNKQEASREVQVGDETKGESLQVDTTYGEHQEQKDITGWEKLRLLAEEESSREDCANLLREMELDEEDSEPDSDFEINDELTTAEKILLYSSTKRNLFSDLEICADTQETQMDQPQDAVTKNKKQRWGPAPLCDKPRRGREDGRTMLQKAMDLKSYKNLGTSKNQGNSFAVLDNEHLMHVAKSADISLGADIQHMTDNIDIMKSEEVKKCDNFIIDFPEIALPVNLECELDYSNVCSNKPTSLGPDHTQCSQMKADKTWSQVVQGAMKHPNNSDFNHDRGHVEC